MSHHGEHVRKVIKESGLTITSLCKKMRRSRRWLYDIFEQKQVGVDILHQIGQAINYDLLSDFPEFSKFKYNPYTQLPEINPLMEGDHLYWKEKYFGLLEKYTELLRRELESKDKSR
ncbi:MAG: hypothetical protein FGM54_01305 [Chitinophagaceae bacterium]|nr:hypothetical protein [Chitinophagaceae bacterium]